MKQFFAVSEYVAASGRKGGNAVEIKIDDDDCGNLTWSPPGPVQEIVAELEQVNFKFAEQYVLQIEHVFKLFLFTVCLSNNALPIVGDTSLEILCRMLLCHSKNLLTILRDREESVLTHEALGPDPFVPDSTEQSAAHEQEKEIPPVGPDDNPERIKRIWTNLLSVKTKKKK